MNTYLAPFKNLVLSSAANRSESGGITQDEIIIKWFKYLILLHYAVPRIISSSEQQSQFHLGYHTSDKII